MSLGFPPSPKTLPKALETHKVSVGRFFILKCSPGHTNVTWKRGGGNSSLPAGVEVKDAELWFLPVVQAHDGKYICHNRYAYILQPLSGVQCLSTFVVPLQSLCPAAVESKRMKQGPLHCKLDLPRGTTRTAPVEWLKECVPVNLAGGNLEVTQKGDLRFLRDSETNAGLYTCLLHMSLGDNNYTAARSLNLTLGNSKLNYPSATSPSCCPSVIHLLTPSSLSPLKQLSCINPCWCIRRISTLIASQQGLCYFLPRLPNQTLALSTPAFENTCMPVCLSVCLSACLSVCLSPVSDGMLYDAYVSYQYSGEGRSSEVVTFALKVLPEVLEKRHGFSLFIRGRDDSPGEALHDVIAEAVSKSRRLVLILSGQGDSETSPLHPSPSQLAYEHSVGLYDALTQRGLRVILVEIDGPVDYTALPESVRYIKRTQGALRWPGDSPRYHVCTKLSANSTFWKSMRYHMPPAPRVRGDLSPLGAPGEQ
uniref:Uncharacterized protein n=1 Tax=Gadus morhua TaxID=8049 RepID=A0A8C4ZE52_GADMO